MITNLLITFGISCFLGGVINAHSNSYVKSINNNDDSSISFKLESSESITESEVSYPIYNDEYHEITLSAYQLNNYIFENIYNSLDSEGIGLSDCVIQIVFSNDEIYATDAQAYSTGAWSLKLEDSLKIVSYVYNVDDFEAVSVPDYSKQNYTFANYFDDDGEVTYYNFSDEIVFSCESEYYSLFKNAIQLDIEVNESDNMSTLTDILSDIVSLLTSGIVGMGQGIANGVNSMITSLVIENGDMAIFIGVVAIFGGIALAVGITRRIFAWVESLGARG